MHLMCSFVTNKKNCIRILLVEPKSGKHRKFGENAELPGKGLKMAVCDLHNGINKSVLKISSKFSRVYHPVGSFLYNCVLYFLKAFLKKVLVETHLIDV